MVFNGEFWSHSMIIKERGKREAMKGSCQTLTLGNCLFQNILVLIYGNIINLDLANYKSRMKADSTGIIIHFWVFIDHWINDAITTFPQLNAHSDFLLFSLTVQTVIWWVTMAQLALKKKNGPLLRTATFKIMGNGMESKIKQFELTLIGRLLNPSIQRMDSLLVNFPKIWKLEDRVQCFDLGASRFQFIMASEEDLVGVLKNEPYFFDGWMVSLVRWEPSFAPNYPSSISFWVKLLEVPLHVWDEAILKAVGDALGKIREIDEESGSVFVTIDGFNPLHFHTEVPFDSSDVIEVGLSYDKLAIFCTKCHKLTYSADECLERMVSQRHKEENQRGKGSYVDVVSNRLHDDNKWEVQRKPPAKRTLNFREEENIYVFPYKYDGQGRERQKNSRDEQQQQPRSWVDRKGIYNIRDESQRRFKGTRGKERTKTTNGHKTRAVGRGNSEGASSWPKPLYQSKELGESSAAAVRLQAHIYENLNDNDTLKEMEEGSDHLAVAKVSSNTEKDDLMGDLLGNLIGEEDGTLEDGEFQDDFDFDLDHINDNQDVNTCDLVEANKVDSETYAAEGAVTLTSGGSQEGSQKSRDKMVAISKPHAHNINV